MKRHFDVPQGATPITDCSGLIPLWVHTLSDLNRVEAENILKAQRKYLKGSFSNFHPEELRSIHRAMFGDVWEWAGAYRKSITTIGIKPSLIPMRLAEFCHGVNAWFETPPQLTFVEMAAKIHHQLVFIHPFENGNGRFSRLIADRFLLAWKCSYPSWPELNSEGVTRRDYINTLKMADKGEYMPLVGFMKQLGASNPKISELVRDNLYRIVMGMGGSSIVKAMVESGANPNDETGNGHRALQLAIKAGLDSIVQILVELGADVNATDRSGLTPFQVAVNQGNKFLVDFLILNGAQPQSP
ncbi:MAG: mobile mystery protein B [Parachlamydiaceae bacterium]